MACDGRLNSNWLNKKRNNLITCITARGGQAWLDPEHKQDHQHVPIRQLSLPPNSCFYKKLSARSRSSAWEPRAAGHVLALTPEAARNIAFVCPPPPGGGSKPPPPTLRLRQEVASAPRGETVSRGCNINMPVQAEGRCKALERPTQTHTGLTWLQGLPTAR